MGLMIQQLRRLGAPVVFRFKVSAAFLVCVGIAMTLGVVGPSAASAPTFADQVSYPTGVRPQSIAMRDLNGDGKPELATANRAGTVSVLANTGGGNFAAKLDYMAGFEPASIASGDLNGDGKAGPCGRGRLLHEHPRRAPEPGRRQLPGQAGLRNRSLAPALLRSAT